MITNKIDQSPPIFFWQNNFLGKISQPAQIIEKGNLAQRTGAPQSRQSAKLFLQSSELRLPQPITRRQVCPPPPLFRGGGHTRWRERGLESPNSDEGTYSVVLCIYIYVLCEVHSQYKEDRQCSILHAASSTYILRRQRLALNCTF
jgi:hypothetical protein